MFDRDSAAPRGTGMLVAGDVKADTPTKAAIRPLGVGMSRWLLMTSSPFLARHPSAQPPENKRHPGGITGARDSWRAVS